MCVIMLLFVCERVANAQEVATEDVAPDLTPDEEIPWEVTPDKDIPWEETPKTEIPREEAPKTDIPVETVVTGEYVLTQEHNMAVMHIAGTSGDLQKRGSGFACKFKNHEFIATNLHAIEGVTTIKVTLPTGKPITLSDQMIASEESDVCLIGIKGNFADLGIVPLEFMEEVVNGSKSGDEIVCLGNGLGKDVISAKTGKIKAVGDLTVEIDVPAAGANGGGPVIHRNSGKVMGIVAGSNMDQVKSDQPDNEAVNVDESMDQTSYSVLRVDAVKKWKSLKLSEFTKSSSDIANARSTVDNIYNFLTNQPQWREDKSLSAAWENYVKFREETEGEAATQPVETGEIDEFELLTARTTGTKRKSVAQADYDKARLSIIKALDWKVQAIQDMIKKSTPVGSRQIEEINRLKADSQQLADAIKRM